MFLLLWVFKSIFWFSKHTPDLWHPHRNASFTHTLHPTPGRASSEEQTLMEGALLVPSCWTTLSQVTSLLLPPTLLPTA